MIKGNLDTSKSTYISQVMIPFSILFPKIFYFIIYFHFKFIYINIRNCEAEIWVRDKHATVYEVTDKQLISTDCPGQTPLTQCTVG